MVAPIGGEKDTIPPEIISTNVLKDNEKYIIEFVFNEFIILNDWNKYAINNFLAPLFNIFNDYNLLQSHQLAS